MPKYSRIWQKGGTYFFTVNLLIRKNNHLLIKNIDLLKNAIRKTKNNHPFEIHAWVVLPEHFHCIISLPPNDDNFAVRIRLIKMFFTKNFNCNEQLSESRIKRGERGIWQRRYWEHLIRDDRDFEAHTNYVHYNPVKRKRPAQPPMYIN